VWGYWYRLFRKRDGFHDSIVHFQRADYTQFNTLNGMETGEDILENQNPPLKTVGYWIPRS
jgi:hypothetical protein